MLSSDAYGAFEEAGVLNPEIGARFRHEVLACGGSRPALESFVAFRGRKPQIDALLRHNGMTARPSAGGDMKTRTIALTFLATALAGALLAQAQSTVYRWVDKDGKVHFSDTPPPADAKDATQRRVGGGGTEDTQLPYATQVAARRNPVTLFVGAACGDPCDKGRDLLTRRGIPYTERDAQANPEDAAGPEGSGRRARGAVSH